jgi:hypothetical protein
VKTVGRVDGRYKEQWQARKIQEHAVWTPDDNSETTTALRLGLMKERGSGRGVEWRGDRRRRTQAGARVVRHTYNVLRKRTAATRVWTMSAEGDEDGQLGRQTAAEGLSSVIGGSGQRSDVFLR